mmetsp:Transcript_24104/g.52432  ORF Transcript_24104/g.52432 Transcript_24104/m.52432 type:complete len:412 (-) Transcript_24104:11-1246(-)
MDELEVVLGRGPWQDVERQSASAKYVCISSNRERSISKHHARVFIMNGKWYIKDAGSRNGLFYNFNKVNQAVALRVGARLDIGSAATYIVHAKNVKTANREPEENSLTSMNLEDAATTLKGALANLQRVCEDTCSDIQQNNPVAAIRRLRNNVDAISNKFQAQPESAKTSKKKSPQSPAQGNSRRHNELLNNPALQVDTPQSVVERKTGQVEETKSSTPETTNLTGCKRKHELLAEETRTPVRETPKPSRIRGWMSMFNFSDKKKESKRDDQETKHDDQEMYVEETKHGESTPQPVQEPASKNGSVAQNNVDIDHTATEGCVRTAKNDCNGTAIASDSTIESGPSNFVRRQMDVSPECSEDDDNPMVVAEQASLEKALRENQKQVNLLTHGPEAKQLEKAISACVKQACSL